MVVVVVVVVLSTTTTVDPTMSAPPRWTPCVLLLNFGYYRCKHKVKVYVTVIYIATTKTWFALTISYRTLKDVDDVLLAAIMKGYCPTFVRVASEPGKL